MVDLRDEDECLDDVNETLERTEAGPLLLLVSDFLLIFSKPSCNDFLLPLECEETEDRAD